MHTVSFTWLFLLLFCPLLLGVFFTCLVTLAIQSYELTRFFLGEPPITFLLGWSDTQEQVPLWSLAATLKARWGRQGWGLSIRCVNFLLNRVFHMVPSLTLLQCACGPSRPDTLWLILSQEYILGKSNPLIVFQDGRRVVTCLLRVGGESYGGLPLKK